MKKKERERRRRAKATSLVSPYEVMSRCAWCMEPIGQNEPVVTFGVARQPGFDLTGFYGKAFPVSFENPSRVLWGIVPMPGSEAVRAGHDVLFTFCSDECAQEARTLLVNAMHPTPPAEE